MGYSSPHATSNIDGCASDAYDLFCYMGAADAVQCPYSPLWTRKYGVDAALHNVYDGASRQGAIA
jgi:hypothetical protein